MRVLTEKEEQQGQEVESVYLPLKVGKADAEQKGVTPHTQPLSPLHPPALRRWPCNPGSNSAHKVHSTLLN